jgi:tetratricopeptide (TPR) repeat protein
LIVAILVILGWIGSVCLHEFGHAIAAYWGGDTSVKDKGYLTLNPLKYVDVSMSLVLPLLFLLIGGIPLPGAAVYINTHLLHNRSWHSLVSAAGPAATILVVLLLAVPFQLGLANPADPVWQALALLAYFQVAAAVLNLLPIPPLDGYGIFRPWLPKSVQQQLRIVEKYGFWVFLGLLWTVPVLGRGLWETVNTLLERLGVPMDMVRLGYESFDTWGKLLLVVAIIGVILYQRLNPRKEAAIANTQANSHENLEATLATYDQALQRRQDDPELWMAHANLLEQLRRHEQAIASYDQALTLQTQAGIADPAPAWGKGNILFALARYEEAIHAYDQALAVSAKNAQLLQNRGLALSYLGRHQEAASSYDQALKARPDDPAVLNLRGQALMELGKYEAAIADFDRSLSFKPNQLDSLFRRGVCLNSLQRYPEALANNDHILKLQPENAAAWENRGTILKALQRYPEALDAHRRVIELNPQQYSALISQGRILRLLHRYEEELVVYQQALQIEPQHAMIWFYCGLALKNLERYEEAIAAFDRALELKPDLSDGWHQRGLCLQNLDQYQQALHSLEQSLKIWDEEPTVWSDKGFLLMKVEDCEGAIAAYGRAQELEPENAYNWYNQACAYARQGDLESTLERLEEALGLDPETFSALASKDPDFDNLRNRSEFQQLIKVSAVRP